MSETGVGGAESTAGDTGDSGSPSMSSGGSNVGSGASDTGAGGSDVGTGGSTVSSGAAGSGAGGLKGGAAGSDGGAGGSPWTCDPSYFGTEDGCDCGCGVVDPDCADATVDSCEYCTWEGSCASSCDDIMPDDNAHCDTVDDCDPDPCVNGSCTDIGAGYTCACDTGWDGDNCDVNIDDCDPNPCVNGTCIDDVASYTCDCDHGWDGDNCDVNICPNGEYSGDLNITDQSQVSTLEGYTSISGTIDMRDCNTCTDLSAYSCLTSVGGNLFLDSGWYYGTLPNADGLEALTTVGGLLSISDNPLLTNVNALSSLTSVGGDVLIHYNPLLTNLDGLSGLTTIGGSLQIWDNQVLSSLDGLSGLTTVGIGTDDIGLVLVSNPALPTLSGLSSLTAVGGFLSIANMQVLPDCEVCGLLAHLSSGPAYMEPVEGNLSDTCTPVPDNCP